MRSFQMLCAGFVVLAVAGCGDGTLEFKNHANQPASTVIIENKTVVEKPTVVEKKVIIEQPVIEKKTVIIEKDKH